MLVSTKFNGTIGGALRHGQSLSAMACLTLALCIVVISKAQVSTQMGIWIHGSNFSKPQRSTVLISAVESNWRAGVDPIMGYKPLVLAPDTFQVFVDDKSVGVVESSGFEQSDVGLDMVIALDVSGSVAQHYEFVKRGIAAYLERRRPEKDQISIVAFASTVNVSEFGSAGKYSPFTGSIESLKQFIATPPSKDMQSRTLLFRAATEAVRTAARGRLDVGDRQIQKALFVLSDGHEDHGDAVGFDVNSPIQEAKKSQIEIFCVGLPEEQTGSMYHDNLRKMADETGGAFMSVTNLQVLEGFFEQLDRLIKNERVLTFRFPVDFADGKPGHLLRVQAKHGTELLSKSIQVQAPAPYPCPECPQPLPWWVWPLMFGFLLVLSVFLLAYIRMKGIAR